MTLGLAEDGALLVVVHTYAAADAGATVRIISARTATKRERADYEHGQEGR